MMIALDYNFEAVNKFAAGKTNNVNKQTLQVGAVSSWQSFNIKLKYQAFFPLQKGMRWICLKKMGTKFLGSHFSRYKYKMVK